MGMLPRLRLGRGFGRYMRVCTRCGGRLPGRSRSDGRRSRPERSSERVHGRSGAIIPAVYVRIRIDPRTETKAKRPVTDTPPSRSRAFIRPGSEREKNVPEPQAGSIPTPDQASCGFASIRQHVSDGFSRRVPQVGDCLLPKVDPLPTVVDGPHQVVVEGYGLVGPDHRNHRFLKGVGNSQFIEDVGIVPRKIGDDQVGLFDRQDYLIRDHVILRIEPSARG